MRAVETYYYLAVKIKHRYAQLAGFFIKFLCAAGDFVDLDFFIIDFQAVQILFGRVAEAAGSGGVNGYHRIINYSILRLFRLIYGFSY